MRLGVWYPQHCSSHSRPLHYVNRKCLRLQSVMLARLEGQWNENRSRWQSVDNFPVRSPKRESSTAGFRTLVPRFSDSGTPDYRLSTGLWNPLQIIESNISSNSLGYQSPVLLSASLDNSMLRQGTPRASGMAQIHDLILNQGIEAARAQTISKAERVAADAAFRVMSDEEQRIGIMHAGFAMTALPHRATTETVWERQSGDVKLLLESGRTSATELIGLPYGSVARMILLYLQTEAVRTRSRDVELGRSMNTWLNSMGMGNGGHNYNLVREQSRRLSLCRLTFLRVSAKQTFITNGSFVHDAILPNDDTDDYQLQFWKPCVRLDEGFYKSLIEHPLPVREAAIRSLGHRSMAIDIYLWLAYRLHILEKPIKLTWHNLANQFGSGFADIKNFKKKFKEPLALALAAYPDAKVELEHGGLVLHPSRPPVESLSSGGTRVRVVRVVDL